MRTQLIQPVTLSEADTSKLAQLLIYSWTAEYALRIEIANDPTYKQSAIGWVFPQAFYAASFSMRAVLLTLGETISFELSQLAAASVFHKHGLYVQTSLTNTFLEELQTLKYTAQKFPEQFSTLNIYEEQARLIGIVEQVATAHEAHIIDEMGPLAYTLILDQVPDFLKNSFLRNRTTHLLEREVVPC